ncbi:hypothetical protein DFH94DRAFT_639399, partial [Russula ochroleuca]
SLETSALARRPLLFIPEDLDGEALAASILLRLHGWLHVADVKAPNFGDFVTNARHPFTTFFFFF